MEVLNISCPRGKFAVYGEDQVVTIVVIGAMGIQNAGQLIDAINRVQVADKNSDWRYLISIKANAIFTPEAEQKLLEFLKFKSWLGSTLNHECRTAIIFDCASVVTTNQIKRTFVDSEIQYRVFEDRAVARVWVSAMNNKCELH
jgi:hypothetical protein